MAQRGRTPEPRPTHLTELMPNSMPLPSIEDVHQLLSYEPEAGSFLWKNPTSPRVKVGSAAGSVGSEGYLSIRINKRLYKAHRIAWLLMTGSDPGHHDIDHINGNTLDNRWRNLRLATNNQNSLNSRRRKNNTSGVKGVSWNTRGKCWIAQLRLSGKTVLYKRFTSFEKACDAVASFRKKYHGRFARHE